MLKYATSTASPILCGDSNNYLKFSFVANGSMADEQCCGSQRDGSFTEQIVKCSVTSLSNFDKNRIEIRFEWNWTGLSWSLRFFFAASRSTHQSWACFLFCMFTSVFRSADDLSLSLPQTPKWHLASGFFLLVGSNIKPYDFNWFERSLHFPRSELFWNGIEISVHSRMERYRWI